MEEKKNRLNFTELIITISLLLSFIFEVYIIHKNYTKEDFKNELKELYEEMDELFNNVRERLNEFVKLKS